MAFQDVLVVVLIVVIVALLYLVMHYREKLREALSSKQSLSTKYGQMSEQFIPFLKGYAYDPQNFSFLGQPIDGVTFENDKIVFLEFKVGSSQLNQRQRNVKRLVEEGKVFFEEIRLNEQGLNSKFAAKQTRLDN